MKKQLKRFSKSTLAIVLTLCMLISCMTVGMIATDAAKVDSESVGAYDYIRNYKNSNKDIYFVGTGNWAPNPDSKLTRLDGNHYSGQFVISGNSNNSYDFKLYVDNEYYSSGYGFHSEYQGGIMPLGKDTHDNMTIALGQNSESKRFTVSVELYCEWENDNNSKLTVKFEELKGYYLHYAENDSGMSSATVQQMQDNGDGTYSYTVNGWDKTLMNMIVNTSSTNVTELYDSTSLTVTADTGLSVEKDTPGENSSYFRMQLSLATTPQNITFTFNPSTGVLNAAGSLEKRTITAGGQSTSYKLKATDGSTQITNYGATNSAQYIDGKTITVTVTPTDSSYKVSSVSVTGSGNTPSAVTNNGDGTYTATFTVKAAGTITAELTKKAMPTVSFSGTNGTVTATANGAPLTNGQVVMEGTKVTFTAIPNDGYEFVSWSGISATTATATVTVGSANMNVAGTFGTKGYQLFTRSEGSSGTLTNMKELPNGWFISGAIEDGKYFTIKRVANRKYVNAKGDKNTYYKWHSEWMGYEHQDGVSEDWEDSAGSANTFYYWNNTGKTVYFVYDPATQKVWVTEQSDGLIPVKIYVKDGTIRYNDNTNTFTTTGKFGDSTIVTTGLTIDNTKYKNPDDANDCWVQVITLKPSDYRNGKDIKIKTEVNSTHKDYYVKGFDVTGRLTQAVVNQEFSDAGTELPSYADHAKIHGTDNSNKPYNEFTLRIEGYPASDIEVTPIYYKRAAKSTDNVRFYATDFTGDVKKNWGGTLAVYPYVEQKKNGDTVTQNGYAPFGDYPGQPMVNEGGRYVVDIPATFYDEVTKKNIPIQGLTMNNYVWDRVHSDIFYGTASLDYSKSTTSTIHKKISQHNYQTYDFNEFEVINRIFQNDAALADEDIIFSFKYKNEVELKDSNLGLSTYYTESANSSETRAYDYRNGFKTIEANDSKYQFEDLTDFYNNRVDIFGQLVDTDVNETKKDYNPILIVSNGYDFNKVGKYATAWALYKPVDANNQVAWEGEVDHYELFEVMGGQGRSQQDYPGESYLIDPDYSSRIKCKYGDTNKLSEYQAAFEADNPGKTAPAPILDCENIPVKITYEYEGYSAKSNLNLENEQGDGNPGHRSDGRWYYSKNDQLLTAHTKIAIYDAASDTYTLDNYQDGIDFDFENQDYDMTKHTGKSTGIQAYFTNTNPVTYAQGHKQNVSGNTEAYAVSDGAHDFEMTTIGDPKGNYTFMGWYLYNGKDYILAGETEEYAQEAKANDIFVAVYKKVPSGSLNVSHMLLDTSTGNAECYAKVEVMSGGNPIYTYVETKGTINVTSTYIKDNSDNTLRITLRTVPDSTSSFTQYLDKISGELKTLAASNHNFIDTVSVDTSNPAEIRATITTKAIKTLFTDGTQTLKSLPFFSKLDEATKSFTITKTLAEYRENDGFPFTIYTSTNGTDWVFLAGKAYTSSTPANASSTSNTGNLQIHQDETVTFSNIPANTYVKIVESGAVKDYLYDSATAKKHTDVSTNAANFSDDPTNKTVIFQLTDDDVDVTINNKRQEYSWIIKFTYDSRLWGEQGYQAEGTFTKAQLDEYTVYGDVVDSSTNNTVQGIKFKDETARAAFVQKYAPHEDNYRKTVKWNFDTFTEDFHFNNKQISMGQKAQPGQEELLTVRYDFPCKMSHSNAGSVPDSASMYEGLPEAASDTKTSLNITNVSYMNWYCLNNAKIVKGVANKEPIFVSAPEAIIDTTNGRDHAVVKYFKYWSVKTMNADPEKCVEYTRCYNREFNYAFYQNSIVTPVYVEAEGPFNHNEMARTAVADTPASITFLETSRNIWNNKECGTAQKVWNNEGKYSDYGDRIFVDFVLDLHYVKTDPNNSGNKQNIQLNSIPKSERSKYHAGLLIQKLGALEFKSGSTTEYETDGSYYANLDTYKNADGKEAAMTALTGNTATSANNYFNSKISVDKFDNKNELEYYYHFANISQAKDYRTRTDYKNYVYRAYTYLYVDGEDTQIISDPVYFTMYDMASIENDYERDISK